MLKRKFIVKIKTNIVLKFIDTGHSYFKWV
jgi:hypothetical protein